MHKNIESIDFGIDVFRVGPEGKFVKFIVYESKEPGHEKLIVNEDLSVRFSCKSSIECVKLSKIERSTALRRMIGYLKNHLHREIELRLISEKLRIEREVYAKYNIEKIEESLRKLEYED